MTENKKAAIMLGMFVSATLCTAGFTGKEELLETNKSVISTSVDIRRNFSDMRYMDKIDWRMAQAIENELQYEKELAAENAAKRAQEEEKAQMAQTQNAALLASIIFCEAGNQPYDGQVAVGAVVMNRVNSSVFPNTIEEVIYQSGQFTPAITGWLDQVRSTGGYTGTNMQAAVDALSGANPVGGCLYFDRGGSGLQIGDHYFH